MKLENQIPKQDQDTKYLGVLIELSFLIKTIYKYSQILLLSHPSGPRKSGIVAGLVTVVSLIAKIHVHNKAEKVSKNFSTKHWCRGFLIIVIKH